MRSKRSEGTMRIDSSSENVLIPNKNEEPKELEKVVDLGYYDTYEKLPKLTFVKIPEKDFLKLEQKNYVVTQNPSKGKDCFYIQTAFEKHKYNNYKDYGAEKSWSGFEYLGYYPDFNLYAITENSTSENLGFGQLFLLDSLTDYKYNIISFGDVGVELPIPSINNKFFVYFYNSVYDHKNCDIGLLKINSKSDPSNYLIEYASYNSTEFAVDKLLWKSDNCFYVKGYEEIYENDVWVKKFTFYKTEFK